VRVGRGRDLVSGFFDALQRLVNARQALCCFLDAFGRKLERGAIVRAEQEEAERLAAEAPRCFVDGHEVSERFRHLFLRDRDEAVVHPVPRDRAAAGPFGLSDLVFVVREDEVGAPAVNVERLAEVLGAHRRALDMPSRPSGSPRALPRGLPGLARLPKREVHRVPLALVDLHARARMHVFQATLGELAVLGKLLDGEVDVPVHSVGKTLLLELLDQLDHLRDVVGGTRLEGRGQAAERADVAGESADIGFARWMILSSQSVKLRTKVTS